jgi:hypothetical protein
MPRTRQYLVRIEPIIITAADPERAALEALRAIARFSPSLSVRSLSGRSLLGETTFRARQLYRNPSETPTE